LTAKHVSALTLSVQQYSDIIERNHTQVDPLTEILVGLQADIKDDELLTGIPVYLHTNLEADCRPCPSAPPEIKVDDETDEAAFADHVEGAYATTYQMRAPGTFQLETGIRDTMRREAAMDDAKRFTFNDTHVRRSDQLITPPIAEDDPSTPENCDSLSAPGPSISFDLVPAADPSTLQRANPAPPSSIQHFQYPQTQQIFDTTGQVAPPGVKPRVTATLWEDEGSWCFQVTAKGVCVARREDNHFINGTKLLNVAGMTRGRRDGILKSEETRHTVKIGPTHLKGVLVGYLSLGVFGSL
jgi:hypothetical protein